MAPRRPSHVAQAMPWPVVSRIFDTSVMPVAVPARYGEPVWADIDRHALVPLIDRRPS
jgi:hypothetical protein